MTSTPTLSATHGSAHGCLRPVANPTAEQSCGSSRVPTLRGACQAVNTTGTHAYTANHGSTRPRRRFESP